MLQSLNRLALASLFLLSTVVTADAAIIGISEQATSGGGTLVNDGSGDVSSSDGSASGDALAMSTFGITPGNLADDLAQFSITGVVSDADGIARSDYHHSLADRTNRCIRCRPARRVVSSMT